MWRGPTRCGSEPAVPTWNYEVVHAHGTLTVRDDERFVRGVARAHEARGRQDLAGRVRQQD